MKNSHRSSAPQAKLNPRKVEVKDLNLKARQLRVRGGGKSYGRVTSPTSLTGVNTSYSPIQMTSLQ